MHVYISHDVNSFLINVPELLNIQLILLTSQIYRFPSIHVMLRTRKVDVTKMGLWTRKRRFLFIPYLCARKLYTRSM